MNLLRNREEAAKLLANQLEKYKDQDGVILAIPRGGVPVAAPIARHLHMPLDLALVKKIGHPANPEFAIGSVSLHTITIDTTLNVPESYVTTEAARVQEQLHEKYKLFMGNRKPVGLQNKVVIIVDDGIATGKTLLATIALVKAQKPLKIIVAVPVAPPEVLSKIEQQADEVVCLFTPPNFEAVGQFYKEFKQTSDEEVMRLLQQQD